MEIIAYNITYLTACAGLFIKVFNSPPWNGKWTFERASLLLTNFSNIPGFKGFIGLENNKVIAACFGYKKTWWNNDEFYIEEMFVDSEYQRFGYGSKLMDYIQEVLKKENIKAITLLTGRETPAKDFYHKNGFYTIEDMIFMKKKFI